MCNTRSNIFLQSMKTNPLSVKKLMKNLILRTLRQLYTVSEIIILIRWVMPPIKVENLQFEFLQFLQSSNSLALQFPQSFRLCSSLLYIHTHIWAILLRVTEYYSVTLFELTVSGGCSDVFETVELMLSVLFNTSSSLVQNFFVIFLSERGV